MVDVQDKLDQVTEENEILKNVEAECESLKLRLENAVTRDTSSGGGGGAKTSDEQQLRTALRQLEADLAAKDDVIARLTAARERHESTASTDEIGGILPGDQANANLVSENMRLQQDLNTSVHESRNLAKQMQTWKEQLSASAADFDGDDGGGGANAPSFRQEQAYRSVGALQLRVEELTLEVTKLLEERDTLQLKLSNVMRQFERQKESVSRASTACSTPIPWPVPTNPAVEVRELKQKIEELGKLNYALDVQLQKEREDRKHMQASLRGGSMPTTIAQQLHSTSSSRSSPRVVDNRESTSPESSAGAIFDV